MPEEDLYGNTKAQLLARIDVAMGGRVGEEIMHGKEQVTDGASGDFQSATRIATMMVKKLGMSEKVGQRVHNDPAMDGGNSFIQVNDLSPEMQHIIDLEINRILAESYARATEILKSHHKEHLLLSEALMKYETLDKDEIKAVIEGKSLKRNAPEKKKK
ncbi:ATP-dependent zinc metalloprotease YME1 homolog [Mercenaria mercenaria]|uniref:ATP-dependent zinc metalloprotease YME1 homolog n=1 Tax=Mercenaria mercenaria TaxID=6596 RepID=UPI00234EDE8C|nr:ATP-dependent zinc metalloprotease YME1 homolog [Mercenaria mercenaria]